MKQINLLSSVSEAYLSSDEPVSNQDLYACVAADTPISKHEVTDIQEVGESKTKHNLYHRKIRWIQQSLKQQGIIQRVKQSHWEMTAQAKIKLRAIKEGNRIIALSTKHGVCLWSSSDDVFKDVIDEPIHLILTSPPYPLKTPRAYGNVDVRAYVEFVCEALEPIVKKMAQGASLALNVSNDIFEDKSPARSTYLERLIIAIEDELGLSKMDTLQWVSNKAPGPIAWASKKRYQLNVGYEPILWFCNNPHLCFADNRRVLMPHEDKHKKFIESGGLKTATVNADGNYRKKAGSFSNRTDGKIPRNVLNFSNYCHSGRKVGRYAKSLGIAPHSAKMPVPLASFLIQYLSRPNDLVVDPFAGTLTTAEAAEHNDRRWVCTEKIWEYIRQSFVRFGDDTFFNPAFLNVG